MGPQQITSIQLFFSRKVVRQNHTDVTSLSMQLEKEGLGLLQEVFQIYTTKYPKKNLSLARPCLDQGWGAIRMLTILYYHARPSLPIIPDNFLTPPNHRVFELHDTAAA